MSGDRIPAPAVERRDLPDLALDDVLVTHRTVAFRDGVCIAYGAQARTPEHRYVATGQVRYRDALRPSVGYTTNVDASARFGSSAADAAGDGRALAGFGVHIAAVAVMMGEGFAPA